MRLDDRYSSDSNGAQGNRSGRRVLRILGVPVDGQPFAGAINMLLEWAQDTGKRYVSTCTAYSLVIADQDASVCAAFEDADMVTADGMPLVWLQRLSGLRDAERVYGPDVVQALCQRTQGLEGGHYFFGGQPGIADALVDALKARFPGLIIAGADCPPENAMANLPDWAAIERINAAKPAIIWIGLGSPKQDVWMNVHRPHLTAPLMIGVGAAFDFLSGAKQQAPVWMRRTGLEWLFRLLQEPGRLWKRYTVYNLVFAVRVAQQMVRGGKDNQ